MRHTDENGIETPARRQQCSFILSVLKTLEYIFSSANYYDVSLLTRSAYSRLRPIIFNIFPSSVVVGGGGGKVRERDILYYQYNILPNAIWTGSAHVYCS